MQQLLIFLTFIFFLNGTGFNAQEKETSISLKSSLPTVNEPTLVYIGYYVNSIRNIDLNRKTFYADFYLWVRFHTSSEDVKQAILQKVEYMNVRDRNLLSQMPNDQWSIGNEHYSSWRVQGEFFFDPKLKNYPFDAQIFSLPIENAQLDADQLIFISDVESYKRGGISQRYWGTDGKIPNLEFKFLQTDLKVDTHAYASDFGNLKINSKSIFSRSTIELYFQRNYWGYVLKILLPLMIIVGMSYVVFYIQPSEIAATAGISVTSLLSCLALNFVIAQTLPSIGFLIKNDYFFLLSYVLILLTLAVTVLSFNLYNNNKAESAAKAKKLGRLLFPFLYLFCFAYLIMRNAS